MILKLIYIAGFSILFSFTAFSHDSKDMSLEEALSAIHGTSTSDLISLYPDRESLKSDLRSLIIDHEDLFLKIPAIKIYGHLVSVDYQSGLDNNDLSFFESLLSKGPLSQNELIRRAIYTSLASTGSYEALDLLNHFFSTEKEHHVQQHILESSLRLLGKSTDDQYGERAYFAQETSSLREQEFTSRQKRPWSDQIENTKKNSQRWYSTLSDDLKKIPELSELNQDMKTKIGHFLSLASNQADKNENDTAATSLVEDNSDDLDQNGKGGGGDASQAARRDPQSVAESERDLSEPVSEGKISFLLWFAILLGLLSFIIFLRRKV